MSIVFVLIVCALVLFAAKKIHHLYVMDRMVAALPSPQSKPVIGHLSHFLVPKAIDFYRKILDSSFEFDQTIKLWIGPILAVIIQDKDHIQAVLECVDKPIIYESLPVFSHNGLVTSKGD